MDGRKGNFRRDVQGLRAIAVLLVLAFHADIPRLSGGFVGVDVFFVVSGFVIGMNLFRELDSTGTIALRSFYQRRIRRILPPLALALATTTLAALLFESPLGPALNTGKTALATVFFSANIKLALDPNGYFDAVLTSNPLLHMWSLSVEEQFYFVAPTVMLFAAWIAKRRKTGNVRHTVKVVLFVFGLASTALCLSVSLTSVFSSIARAQTFAFYGSPFRAWEFICGLLVAAFDPQLAQVRPRLAKLLSLTGVALLGYGAVSFDKTTIWPGPATLTTVLATVSVIAGNRSGNDSGVARLMGSRPAVWIGDISYPLYLWHFPFVVFATNVWHGSVHVKVLATAASVLPAYLSDRLLERPLVQRRRVRSTVVLFGVCLAVPLASVSVNNIVAVAMAKSTRFEHLAQANLQHAGVRECDERSVPVDAHPCTWTSAGSSGDLLLVGDSLAAALTEAAIDTGKALNLNVTVRTASGCPFLDVSVEYNGMPDEVCDAHNRGVLERLRTIPPTELIATFSAQYIYRSSYHLTDASGRVASTPKQKQAMMVESLGRIATELHRAHVPVTLVEPLAAFDVGRIEDCPTLLVLQSKAPCAAEMSKAVYDDQIAGTVAAFTSVRPAPTIVSLNSYFCGTTRCSTTDGRVRLLRDGLHMTVQESHRMAIPLIDAVKLSLSSEAGPPESTATAQPD